MTDILKQILVTGGAGFIGSNFVLQWIGRGGRAAQSRPSNLCRQCREPGLEQDNPITCWFAETSAMRLWLAPCYETQAERHRALCGREPCGSLDRFARRVHSDQCGRHFSLLEEARNYWVGSTEQAGRVSLPACFDRRGLWHAGHDDPAFTESTPYAPNSPYAASKAASDHLVRAYYHTYGCQS